MNSLFNKAMQKCDEAEIYKREEYITDISVQNGKIQCVKGNKVVGITLRINKDGRNGSAVATSLNDETIIDRALLSSRYQKEKTLKFKNLEPSKVNCFDEKVKNLSTEDLKNECQRILDVFKKHDEKIVPDIIINRTLKNIHIKNSSGFDNSYDKTQYSIFILTKSNAGFMEVFYVYNASEFKQVSEEDIKQIIHKHNISQNRVKIKTEKMPIVFSGSAFGSLMIRLLSGVNGGNIVKEVSPLNGKIGEKIASDAITIRDNGKMDFGTGTCPFDDEACPTNDTVIIDKGVLKNYLIAPSQEEKLNMKPTGNSFKRTMFSNDIEDQPSVDSSNFIIEGNNLPDDELIKGIKKGIYIDSVMGAHTGNIPAGEYSLNIGCGYLIEDGKLTSKVMDAMVAGNIYEDLLKIEAIGTNLEPIRALFYTMGYSPAVLFKDLSIVGSE